MIARVIAISTAKSGARTAHAICPNGADVRHGAGLEGEDVDRCLGDRAAHCRCCESYTLARPASGEVGSET